MNAVIHVTHLPAGIFLVHFFSEHILKSNFLGSTSSRLLKYGCRVALTSKRFLYPFSPYSLLLILSFITDTHGGVGKTSIFKINLWIIKNNCILQHEIAHRIFELLNQIFVFPSLNMWERLYTSWGPWFLWTRCLPLNPHPPPGTCLWAPPARRVGYKRPLGAPKIWSRYGLAY